MRTTASAGRAPRSSSPPSPRAPGARPTRAGAGRGPLLETAGVARWGGEGGGGVVVCFWGGGGDAAVGIDDLPVDKGGLVGGEPQGGADDVIDLAPAPGRGAAGDPLGERDIG